MVGDTKSIRLACPNCKQITNSWYDQGKNGGDNPRAGDTKWDGGDIYISYRGFGAEQSYEKYSQGYNKGVVLVNYARPLKGGTELWEKLDGGDRGTSTRLAKIGTRKPITTSSGIQTYERVWLYVCRTSDESATVAIAGGLWSTINNFDLST